MLIERILRSLEVLARLRNDVAAIGLSERVLGAGATRVLSPDVVGGNLQSYLAMERV